MKQTENLSENENAYSGNSITEIFGLRNFGNPEISAGFPETSKERFPQDLSHPYEIDPGFPMPEEKEQPMPCHLPAFFRFPLSFPDPLTR